VARATIAAMGPSELIATEELLSTFRTACVIGDRIAEEHDSMAQDELPLCDRCHRKRHRGRRDVQPAAGLRPERPVPPQGPTGLATQQVGCVSL
jgi:hypothetical protein